MSTTSVLKVKVEMKTTGQIIKKEIQKRSNMNLMHVGRYSRHRQVNIKIYNRKSIRNIVRSSKVKSVLK